jgi:hypothetical protein
MFTIEVKKKERDKKFSFDELALFHSECYGGKVLYYWESFAGHLFECIRCGKTITIKDDIIEKIKSKIVLTAIDGKKRRLIKGLRVIQGD